MHLTYNGVNDAFCDLVNKIYTKAIPLESKQSRNGPVIMIPEPVLITYKKPWQRVLMNKERDCNPFFHLFEAMYMLSGGNEIDPLAYYASNMMNYSDDGKTQNGAYGYRWRKAGSGKTIRYNGGSHSQFDSAIECDQLQILIDHLKADSTSRRAVLQMWNVEDDLLKIGQTCPVCKHQNGANGMDPAWWECSNCKGKGVISSKDVCCNLSVMFSIRSVFSDGSNPPDPNWVVEERFLDMTVTNRSNDMIWGALGANFVHFTFLQEYMATALGVEMGYYHHFTNNLHVYESNWEPEKWLASGEPDWYERHQKCYMNQPLVRDVGQFDTFVRELVSLSPKDRLMFNCHEMFLQKTVKPAMAAFHCHKEKLYNESIAWADRIQDEAWQHAIIVWLTKRAERRSRAKR